VFDNPVNREILGDDGIYVKDREANAFARGILAALEDEAGSAEIGRRLRGRAEERAWSRNRGTLMKVYREAMLRRGKKAALDSFPESDREEGNA
ncbi:MAG: glycosyltransferase, partial [Gemmatimonadetes bacterium]|nr:glycosyltransferase [Gemmatimonadota bacterium]